MRRRRHPSVTRLRPGPLERTAERVQQLASAVLTLGPGVGAVEEDALLATDIEIRAWSRAAPSRVSFRSAQYLETLMCRNIKTLANFEPPATDEEIRASALQFVRKLSGTTHPSNVNEAAFDQAVDEVTAVARRLIDSLETRAWPRNREEEARKARERARKRYA